MSHGYIYGRPKFDDFLLIGFHSQTNLIDLDLEWQSYHTLGQDLLYIIPKMLP